MGRFWVNGIRTEVTIRHFYYISTTVDEPISSCKTIVAMGRFSLSKKFQKCRYGDKWNGNILGKFSENLDIVKFFQKENHPTETSGNCGKKVTWSTNFRLKLSVNFGTPRKVVLFTGNSGKCCSICGWKFRKSNKNFSLN